MQAIEWVETVGHAMDLAPLFWQVPNNVIEYVEQKNIIG
jgi:hypothetical protein